YRSLLENPKAFGENENLAGVIGELSLVREGTEKGFSLNSLLRKYNSLLIGRHLAEIFRKEFPLQFTFADADDVTSVQAQVTDEEGNKYSSKVEARKIEGEEVLNLRNVDSQVMIIPENGDVELSDEIGTSVTLKQGEVGFVMASTNQVVVKAEKVNSLRLTLDE
ncbi:MAG: hypothetical protein KBT27_04880, partial [Prevotellaceae bacterium]|nr:hypothetical protein [Candidatus Faecinaster equi]